MFRKILAKAAFSIGYYPYQYRASRLARIWSNQELAKFGDKLTGSVVNVSAWEDSDKEGRKYRDYFPHACQYFITNYGTDQGALQKTENECYLDLQAPLPPNLVSRFDVVFNHTSLEHIYDFRTAFANLCAMSADIVIIVLPWLQPLHANYGDYWRFSPQAAARLFHDNGMTTLYLSWNETPRSSVYVFAIATKLPEKWGSRLGEPINTLAESFLVLPENFAGRFSL